MSKQVQCHPDRPHRAKGLCGACYKHSRYWINRSLALKHASAWRLKHIYKITLEDYEALFALQNGVCAICKSPPGRRRLSVDHCHSSGRIRGLLCDTCNPMLGNAHDRIDILQTAIDYLKGGLI